MANLRQRLTVVLSRVRDPLATPRMRSHDDARKAWLQQAGRALATGVEPDEWVTIPSPNVSVVVGGGSMTVPNGPSVGAS